jgi:hypothetical protein
MDEETAKYVGVLEGSLARYAIQEAQFRTLLELITGDSWEDVRVDLNGDAIQTIAVDSLVRSGVPRMAAMTAVRQRWQTFNNASIVPSVVPQATAVENVVPEKVSPASIQPATGTMSDRLASWKARNAEAGQSTGVSAPATGTQEGDGAAGLT